MRSITQSSLLPNHLIPKLAWTNISYQLWQRQSDCTINDLKSESICFHKDLKPGILRLWEALGRQVVA